MKSLTNSRTWIKAQIFVVLLTKETAVVAVRWESPACAMSWVPILSLWWQPSPAYLGWPLHNGCNHLATNNHISLQTSNQACNLSRPTNSHPSYAIASYKGSYFILHHYKNLNTNCKLKFVESWPSCIVTTCITSASCKILTCHMSNYKYNLLIIFRRAASKCQKESKTTCTKLGLWCQTPV